MPTRQLDRAYVLPEGFYPDQPLFNGGVAGSALAGLNAVFEADGTSRAIGSPTDMLETYAPTTLGYTAALTGGSDVMTCAAGTLTTDFVPYQHCTVNGVLYLIEELLSATQARISPTPAANVVAGTLKKVLAINPLEIRRAAQFAGNVIKYREEAIFAVGNGEVKIAGASLSAALTAQVTPYVAYPIVGGTYDVRPVGFTKPGTLPTVASIAGGSKNMPTMAFSIKISKKRKGFPGYGLASEAVEQTIAAAGDRFQVTLPAFDAAEGQTAWYIWATKARAGEAVRGPWYLLGEYDTVTPSTINIEWRDEELTERLVDNNFPPPRSLYVASIDDVLFFASCYGDPDSSGNPTAPGPGLAVAKPNNPEGFPTSAAAFVSPAEPIRGLIVGGSRIFPLTLNHLHIGTLTGSATTPIVIRPYWRNGFQHQYSATMAGDVFYGMAGNTLMRTVNGEDADSLFCARVQSVLRGFVPQRCFLGHDPKNGWIVVFHSNDRQVGGFWATQALAFNYKTGKFNCPVLLSDAAADFTVTSCCSVGESLYFATQDGKIYRWDDGAVTVTGFIATPFDDFGSSRTLKTARQVAATGRFNGSLSLYRDYDYQNLIDGTGTVPNRTYSNPGFNRQHFPLWKVNYRGKSIAIRTAFSVAGRTPLLDALELGVDVRIGAMY